MLLAVRGRLTRMRERRDAGESLIELLMALAIMSIAVVAVVGAFVSSIVLSDVHRKQSSAGSEARTYAELVVQRVSAGNYADCAATSYTPAAVGFTPSSGYTGSVAAVAYWTGTAWGSTCSTDIGLQRVTVRVAANDGRASEEVTVVVRKPCGSGSTCTA